MQIGPWLWCWNRPDLWFRNIWWELSLVPQRMGRIIRWIPVLWGIWDFDHSSVTRVLRYQLSKLEECTRLYGHHVSSQQDAKRMRVVLEYLRRQEDNDGLVRLPNGNVADRDWVKPAFEIMAKYYRGWWN